MVAIVVAIEARCIHGMNRVFSVKKPGEAIGHEAPCSCFPLTGHHSEAKLLPLE
jgi:hypothetical protein